MRTIGKGACQVAALFLALALLGPLTARADEREELAGQRDAASSSLANQEAQLEQRERELNQARQQGQSLRQRQEELTGQIYQLSEEIGQLEQQVEQAQSEVNEKQREYESRWTEYKDLLGGMQALRDRGQVAFLLQAQSLYQLLTFSDTLQQMSQAQDQALSLLKTQREALDRRRLTLEGLEQQLQTQRQELKEAVEALGRQILQSDAAITQAEADRRAQQIEVDAARAAFDQAADEYDAYIRAQIAQGAQDNTLSCGLDFQCPLDGYAFLSCHFGEADGWTGKPHCGADFAANAGSTIRAAADGVVQVAGGSESYSYGYYVILYHGRDDAGRTIATLYAHMNEIPCVAAGQSVTRGEPIGRVGNTGYSKGYHLHLELRVDGERTDPLLYIPQ